MKKLLCMVSLLSALISCKDEAQPELSEGVWRGKLSVMEGEKLPFNFLVEREDDAYKMQIYNASEVIVVDEIELKGDSIRIHPPVFEGYISGTFTPERIDGDFRIESLDRVVPFEASFGETERFSTKKNADVNVSGIWETEFTPVDLEAYMGKGIFAQDGNKVTGTFRTTTGDYRYLEGVVTGDSLKLSAFDGAHAFLFTAQVTDSSLNGVFYSGNHSKETFVGKRNEGFELPPADSLTFLKKGYDKFSFSFPDIDGTMVSSEDERFKNKVVIVQILGSWCPNCLDETKFYVNYLRDHNLKNLEVVGLAFEYAKTKEGAIKSIERLKQRIGVNYPILLAQYGSSDKDMAQKKLPMLNRLLSYPTTIFIDKEGKVRHIHTGFNGPATGEKYIEFHKEFDTLLHELLSE
ncbi:TlpA disulfide reductase family protein [Zobellia galactanivorans]|uniref:peroxiredoxin family protein n=1 Tax=Zobellia galactanivorans (strain DSM 12802 / CCUG 47099 / CIP 106680 / NCIMB 13871 / Dsij) TaxID=63186 RepID=UPI0026E23988|nr:TlpA disulfide reductase family protein [Zobellia galactanivorans]MDO6808028.1 TlpA disulfide reductase family protein [Zobellia galactanivorans]